MPYPRLWYWQLWAAAWLIAYVNYALMRPISLSWSLSFLGLAAVATALFAQGHRNSAIVAAIVAMLIYVSGWM